MGGVGRKGRPVPGASTERWSRDQPSSASSPWDAVPAPCPASDQSNDRSGWGGDSSNAGGGKPQQLLMWTEEMLLPCPGVPQTCWENWVGFGTASRESQTSSRSLGDGKGETEAQQAGQTAVSRLRGLGP